VDPSGLDDSFWSTIVAAGVAFGHSLPGSGREAFKAVLACAAEWVGTTSAELNSSDPGQRALGLFNSLMFAAMLVPGPGDAGAAALATEEAGVAGPGAMARLRFEASPKHPDVVPGPAQAGLDTSIGFSENTTRRVGIDYGSERFMVFDETYPGQGIFHGHYREWSELTPAMQAALRKAGMATSRGGVA
jgi:hypothetical protein